MFPNTDIQKAFVTTHVSLSGGSLEGQEKIYTYLFAELGVKECKRRICAGEIRIQSKVKGLEVTAQSGVTHCAGSVLEAEGTGDKRPKDTKSLQLPQRQRAHFRLLPLLIPPGYKLIGWCLEDPVVGVSFCLTECCHADTPRAGYCCSTGRSLFKLSRQLITSSVNDEFLAREAGRDRPCRTRFTLDNEVPGGINSC